LIIYALCLSPSYLLQFGIALENENAILVHLGFIFLSNVLPLSLSLIFLFVHVHFRDCSH